jgi:hypothetical protein
MKTPPFFKGFALAAMLAAEGRYRTGWPVFVRTPPPRPVVVAAEVVHLGPIRAHAIDDVGYGNHQGAKASFTFAQRCLDLGTVDASAPWPASRSGSCSTRSCGRCGLCDASRRCLRVFPNEKEWGTEPLVRLPDAAFRWQGSLEKSGFVQHPQR